MSPRDVSATYVFEEVLSGELTLHLNLTYIDNYDIDPGDGSSDFDGLNNRNASFGQLGSVPDTRFNVGLDWRSDKHTVSLAVRNISSYDDRTPGNKFNSIDSHTVVDLQYMVSFNGLLGGDGFTDVSLGVNNLTDEDPPAIDRDGSNGRRAFDSQVHDARGRIAYLRVKHAF